MSFKQYQSVISQDNILLILFFCVGLFGYVQSLSFAQAPARLPRIASLLILVGCTLIVAKKIIYWVFNNNIKLKSIAEISKSKDHLNNPDANKLNNKGIWRTIIATIMFIILTYLIGFLWSAPIFSFMYLHLHNKPWYHKVTLAMISFAIVGVFVVITNVPLNEGVLLNVI